MVCWITRGYPKLSHGIPWIGPIIQGFGMVVADRELCGRCGSTSVGGWTQEELSLGGITLLREIPTVTFTGWWFGTFFIFPYIGNNHPNWLIFFRGVQTTNQVMSELHSILCLKYANIRRSKASSTFCLLYGVFGETATRMVHLIPPGILSHIYSGILAWNLPGILSGIHSGILSDIFSDILFGILSGIHSSSLSGIYSDILSGILCGILSGILFGIYSDIYLEVQRCPLGSGGPRLRSSGAHWTREVPGWGPAAPTDIGSWQLRSSSAHCDQELARRRGGEEEKEKAAEEGGGGRRRRKARRKAPRAILKSNNPHRAGGENLGAVRSRTSSIQYSNSPKDRN